MSVTETKAGRRSARNAATEPARQPQILAEQAGEPTTNGSTALRPAPANQEIPDYMLNDPDLPFNFAPSEMTTPVIRVLQNKKPRRGNFASVPAGHFVNMNTGEDLGETLHVVVLGMLRSRVLMRPFAEQRQGTANILCRSFDGIYGEGEPGGPCEECALGKFSDNGAPRCVFSFNYVVLPLQISGDDIHDSDLRVGEFPVTAVLRLSKKALPEARKWNKALHDYRPPFATIFRVTASKVANNYDPNDPIYVPTADPKHRIRDLTILETLYTLSKGVGTQQAQIQRSIAADEENEEPDEPVPAGVGAAGRGAADDDLPF